MMKRLILSGLMLCVFAGTAYAQDAVETDPGYVDLQTIEEWFGAEPTLEVNIRGALLELVAEASRYEDPDLYDLLNKLKAIQVRGFRLDYSDFDTVERRTADLAGRLQSEGWDTIVRVREDDERVDMYVRVHEGAIAGMMVMVVEPGSDDTVFLNIVGEINPEQIGRIGRTFDIDPLDDTVVNQRNR